MTEWQDISTAPRGAPILAYMECGRVWVAQVSEENGNCYMLKIDGRPVMLRPTHWMPLPKPPNE